MGEKKVRKREKAVVGDEAAAGHVIVASDTTFLSVCRFQCLFIFVIIILRSCKGVVLANRQLDKFFVLVG